MKKGVLFVPSWTILMDCVEAVAKWKSADKGYLKVVDIGGHLSRL